jgi:signal transduction histidine kinase/CheY-like chemotaxis protein/HPt (histidine-containing phosphotransfer) domain-containing protein
LEDQSPEASAIFLSTVSAGRRELRMVCCAAALLLLTTIVLLPFAPVPLGEVWPFIPVYESALAITDLITAILLISQIDILGSRGLLALAAGYLFTAMMQVPHLMSFPGVFSPTGLLGAGPQTTAFLYMFWHGGFPLTVIAYAVLKDRPGEPPRRMRATRAAMTWTVLVTLLVVCALAAFTFLGKDFLPPVMVGNAKSVPMLAGFEGVWGLGAVALAALLLRRPYSSLDLWLMVVMCAWICDGALSSVFNAGRFDLGFYAGRVFGLLAATFILLVLLLETGSLYRRLARSFANESNERELRLQEQQTARARAEAATAAKSSFLANMSHEIRTPMNAVIGLADLALRTELDAKQQDYLVKIKSSAMALLGIINDILDFSKIEAGRLRIERTEFDLRGVLEGVSNVSTLRAADKGLEFLFSVDPGLPSLLIGDPLRLSQVLHNLVSNAIKFTERGEIVITVGVVKRRGEDIELAVAVSDTGIGIDADTQSRLFRPFTQADVSTTRRFGGTGLGLTISRQLVEMMGGALTLESKVGEGTTFRFNLPLQISARSQEPTRLLVTAFAGARALVVDDSANARQIIETTLAHWGLDVETAGSAAEGIALFRRAVEAGRSHDLLLVDWRMPGMDGIEMARALEASQGRLPPIVLMTAFGRDELMDRAKDTKIGAFLAKPITDSTLLDTVSTALGAAARAPARAAVRAGLETRPAAFAGMRVLLVDDNDINRQVGEELLAQAGLAVDIAENGRFAVDKVLAAAGAYDAVLMDVQMPVMDGFEATRAIRGHFGSERLPIIALTANALTEERDRCLEAGMDDHVAKPIDPSVLLATLERWIKRRPESAADQGAPAPTGQAASVRPGNGSANAAQDLPVSLPPFDIAAALVRVNGKRALLRRLIVAFGEEFAGAPKVLRELHTAGNCKEAERMAHTLKSAAATLGLDTVAAIARDIEDCFRKGKIDAVAPMLVALDADMAPALRSAASLRGEVI